MEEEQLQAFRTWFGHTVRSYHEVSPRHQENIILKEEHTYRVCEAMDRITGELRLDENSRRLAATSALFHDLGRFRQYRVYRTFRDSDSDSHARLSLLELNRARVLHRLEKPERILLSRAIFHHNQWRLPDRIRGNDRLHCRLLRDADKVDIWKVMTDHYHREDGYHNPVMELGLERTDTVNESLVNDFLKGFIPNYVDLSTLNEFKILQMSWIFDINYPPTFRIILERDYIGKIVSSMPKNPKLAEAEAYAKAYMERRMNEGVPSDLLETG